MAKHATETRAAILDAAQELVLSHGFGGTTVDAILEKTRLTKGAFFHHFASKNDLAHALVLRYAQLDEQHLDEYMARAERLSRDPLQQLLIFVGLFEERMAQMAGETPGCLFAAYCYQAQLFDEQVHEVLRHAIVLWRARLADKIRQAMEQRPPRLEVDAEELADGFTVVLEGAFIVARTMRQPDGRSVAQQLRHYRNYLELLFAAP